jgi:hypothetical protein
VQQTNESKVAKYATKERKDVARIHSICKNTKTHLKKMIPTLTHLEPAIKKIVSKISHHSCGRQQLDRYEIGWPSPPLP